MRKIYTTDVYNSRYCKVFYDRANREYIVKTFINNRTRRQADYFTTEKQDAINTAIYIASGVSYHAHT